MQKLTICHCGGDLAWEELGKAGFRRRNTCLLRALAEHPEVERIFVVSNVTRETYARKTQEARGAAQSGSGTVVDVFVARVLPERWWLPGTKTINTFLLRRQARRQMPGLPGTQTVVWCYWPKGFRLATALDLPGFWVFDADHNIVEDANLEPSARQEMEALLMECGRRAGLIVAAARSMLRWFEARGFRQCARLRNGVDTARFGSNCAPAAEVQALPSPRIGYVGTLSRWIDYPLLAGLVRRRPDWTFVIVGDPHNTTWPDELKGLKNVHLLGSRGAEEIPALMKSFDVALGIYQTGHAAWLDVDSMKLFEYLAAGVPVVCAPFHEELQNDFGGLLEIASGVEGFERAINGVLAWTAHQRREWDRRREEFVRAGTWAARAAEAVELVRHPPGTAG